MRVIRTNRTKNRQICANQLSLDAGLISLDEALTRLRKKRVGLSVKVLRSPSSGKERDNHAEHPFW